MFKILKGLDVLGKGLEHQRKNKKAFLCYNNGCFKIRKINDFSSFVGKRHQFFVNRIAKPSWNILPPNVMNFSSLALNGFRAA